MKSEKGITLTSLVIYVVVLFIVIAMLAVIRNNFQNSIKDISEGSSIESEFNKFNIYFAKDAKIEGNKATINENNEIVFSSGNTYGFNSESKNVYLINDRQQIVLLKDINLCIFAIDTSTGKTVITVTIDFSEEPNDTITKEYTLIDGENTYQNEEDYVSVKKKNYRMIMHKLNILQVQEHNI